MIFADNEPIHGILARHATGRGEAPRRLIGRMLPGTGAVSLSFVLPGHISLVSDYLSGLGGAVIPPEGLISKHTFFPVVATFLEAGEKIDLARRMMVGDRVAPYQICHSARAGCAPQRVRWCPVCAAADRKAFEFARWRMSHNLFGVRACHEHGCALVETDRKFGELRELHDAERIIPLALPAAENADGMDLLVARDLADLFRDGSPKPGRRALAAVFHAKAIDAGFVRGASRMLAIADFLDAFTARFGADWLDLRGIDRPTNTNMWPRNCMHPTADIHPAFNLALVARALGSTLPEMLKHAESEPPADPPGEDVRPTVHFSFWPETLERHKRAFEAAKAENPEASRSDFRCVLVPTACLFLAKAAPDWLEAQLPPRVRKSEGVREDWTIVDRQAAERVLDFAAQERISDRRPIRLSVAYLRKSTDGEKWVAKNWRNQLPLYHAALFEHAEDDFAYGRRRATWYHRLIAAKKARPTHSVAVFLKRCALAHLAKKEPRISDFVMDLLGITSGRDQENK